MEMTVSEFAQLSEDLKNSVACTIWCVIDDGEYARRIAVSSENEEEWAKLMLSDEGPFVEVRYRDGAGEIVVLDVIHSINIEEPILDGGCIGYGPTVYWARGSDGQLRRFPVAVL